MRLTFLPDGTVQVRTGKVELGQGISTALAQIAADELGLAPQQVRMLAADTMFGPDEGMTSGSLSVQDAGAALRRACRESGKARPLAEGSRPVVGQSMPRLDLPAKFAGAPSFIHDLDPAGLLHGHSQGIFPLRRDLALAFGLAPEEVRVQHAEGAGCYGHNGADDVAFDAAWLARECPGRPVRVLWSRADELSLAPFGPAMEIELDAALDADGRVLHWRHQVWSPGHSGRPGRSATPALLGSWQTENAFAAPPSINMPLAVGGGAERNAVPGYALPAFQVLSHRTTAPLRSSALRSLGAFGNVFAAESFVDEIAQAIGVDPLEWRRRHLAHDPRGLAVLELAAQRAGWTTRRRGVAGDRGDRGDEGGAGAERGDPSHEAIGHGLGFARYKGTGAWCAVVAEVAAGAQLRVLRLTIAVDVGLAVNPDGVVAQIEGGAVQATSWALKEAVQFDAEGITSNTWERYPILRFTEVPAVAVHRVPSTLPSLGAGEASLGPTAAAIANALFDALGVRVRELPLTAERIAAAINDSPSS